MYCFYTYCDRCSPELSWINSIIYHHLLISLLGPETNSRVKKTRGTCYVSGVESLLWLLQSLIYTRPMGIAMGVRIIINLSFLSLYPRKEQNALQQEGVAKHLESHVPVPPTLPVKCCFQLNVSVYTPSRASLELNCVGYYCGFG